MSWFEIELKVPQEMRESVVNRLFELGAEGVTEDESQTPSVRVQAYFDPSRREEVPPALEQYLESISEFFPGHPRIETSLKAIQDKSWADEYKRYYHPQKLSRSFYLKPAWDTQTEVPPGYIPIVMDPGQAFGTGLHPTTQLCLKLLERALGFYTRRDTLRLIDVGTGTGILAIAAAKLGVGHIDAIDNDPLAVQATFENIVVNETPNVLASENDLSTFKEPYQIVLSNILLETHRELLSEYVRLLVPGGQLILSGLLAHQRQEISELVEAEGFLLESSEVRQEWFAGLYTRVSPESKGN